MPHKSDKENVPAAEKLVAITKVTEEGEVSDTDTIPMVDDQASDHDGEPILSKMAAVLATSQTQMQTANGYEDISDAENVLSGQKSPVLECTQTQLSQPSDTQGEGTSPSGPDKSKSGKKLIWEICERNSMQITPGW